MLLRLQTLYLLLAELLVAAMLMVRLATFMAADGEQLFLRYNGIYSASGLSGEQLVSTWPLATLLFLVLAAGALAVGMYRHPMFQIRICFFNMVMQLGLLVLVAYYIYEIAVAGESTLLITGTVLLPPAAMLLTYMGYKGIVRDQAKVMSQSLRKTGKK